MELIWNPDRPQVARSMQDRKLLRIATVRLNPFPRLARNHRRRNYDASVAEHRQLSIDPIPASAGLVTEVELAVSGKPLRQLVYLIRHVQYHAQITYSPVPAVFRDTDGYGFFMNVESYE
jgi:hypothetical protein